MQELEALLKKKSKHLHQWSVRQVDIAREENYLICDAKKIATLDQNRSVRDQQVWLNIWVPKEKGRIGYSRLLVDMQDDLEKQIDRQLQKAQLTDEEFWVLPQPVPASFAAPKLCFDGFARDIELGSQYFVDDCMAQIRQAAGATFNSAEIFISRISDQTLMSSGFKNTELRSKIYSEVCFSAGDDKDSNEFLVTRVGLHPEQINFPELCQRSLAGAKALLKAEPMTEGLYTVKLDGETMGQLFNDACQSLRGERKYYQLPFTEVGQDFIPNFAGVPFDLAFDPSIEMGLASGQFDEYGSPEQRLTLVSRNKVQANVIDARMAQYLNRSATGSGGNVLVSPEHMLSDQDLEKIDHLEIWQFSGLFSDAQSLTFSSEIRLGELVPANGRRRFVKGGNLSGKFQENFLKIRFGGGRNFVNLNDQAIGASLGFDGPRWGLLNDVSVSS